MDQRTQVIIVGAGPAGIASAIYLHRAGRRLVLLERGELGGLLRNANLVENYPGFPRGIRGMDLVKLFADQLNQLGVKQTKAEAKKIETTDGGFRVITQEGALETKALILATGTHPRRLNLKVADGLIGKRVFFEVADMPSTKLSGQRVIVVGGGDAAFDYGLNLVNRGAGVTIVSRSEPKCLSLLRTRAEASGVELMNGVAANQVNVAKGGVSVAMDNGENLSGEFVLVACGREPNLETLSESLKSRITKGDNFPRTVVPGLFLAGDVVREGHRQTAIAVGDGVRAAMMADEFVESKEAD